MLTAVALIFVAVYVKDVYLVLVCSARCWKWPCPHGVRKWKLKDCRLFFFLRTFFLAQGLVGAVLLGSFQACAICSLGAGRDAAGGLGEGGFGQHLTGNRLVAVGDGACDAVKVQETGRIGGHSCMGDLGRPPVDQGIRE